MEETTLYSSGAGCGFSFTACVGGPSAQEIVDSVIESWGDIRTA